MREIGLICVVLLTAHSCYASDGLSGPELFYNFKLLIGIGLFGVFGSAFMSLVGSSKTASLITKVSYASGFVVFLGIATALIEKFLVIYKKIESFIS